MTRTTQKIGAVFAFWLMSWTFGLLLGLPFFQALKAQGVSSFADGDHLMLREGGAYLLEVFRLGLGQFRSLLLPASLLYGVAWWLVLIPTAALIVSVTPSEASNAAPGLGALATRAFSHLFAFTLLRLLTWTVQASLLVVALGIRSQVALTGLDPQGRDLLSLGILAMAGCGMASIGCLQDVARVTLVGCGATPWRAWLAHGWRVVGNDGGRLLAIWLGLASLALLFTAGFTLATPAWTSGQTSLAWTQHQLLIIGLITLKLVWYGAISAATTRALGQPMKACAFASQEGDVGPANAWRNT